MSAIETKTLPENAYAQLHSGELYLPIVPADCVPSDLRGASSLLETELARVSDPAVREAVLREAARLLEVPPELSRAPKKAAQYSSGIQRLLT